MRVSKILVPAMLLVMLSSISVAAYAGNGQIKVTSVARMEEVVIGADGQRHVQRVDVKKAVPGAVVLFVDSFENVGKKSAGDVVLVNPLPDNTAYQAGSAYGEDTEITFSVDGGKTFAAADKLRAISADGFEQQAKPESYTHIRWIYKKQLAAGATGEVGFRVVIK